MAFHHATDHSLDTPTKSPGCKRRGRNVKNIRTVLLPTSTFNVGEKAPSSTRRIKGFRECRLCLRLKWFGSIDIGVITPLNSTPRRLNKSLSGTAWKYQHGVAFLAPRPTSRPLTLSLPSSSIRIAPLPPSPRSSILSVALSCSSPDVLIALTCTMWWSQRSFAGFFSLSPSRSFEIKPPTLLLSCRIPCNAVTIPLSWQCNATVGRRRGNSASTLGTCHATPTHASRGLRPGLFAEVCRMVGGSVKSGMYKRLAK